MRKQWSTEMEIADYVSGDVNGTAYFQVSLEEYPAEPFSHGGSRGNEVDCEVTMTRLTIGNTTLDCAQIAVLISTGFRINVEDAQRDIILKDYDDGDL